MDSWGEGSWGFLVDSWGKEVEGSSWRVVEGSQ